MAKTKTLFRCSTCDASAPQWAGKCSGCGEWNSLIEERSTSTKPTALASSPISLAEISTEITVSTPTGIQELDRVLGGGVMAGSVTLLGGEPGIGKSTLVLQLCQALASQDKKCLVITGEESVEQVARRAKRLGVVAPAVSLMSESNMEVVLATIQAEMPDFVVIDSIQTMSASGVGSAPGTVSQVRECATALTTIAKNLNVAMLMVGHVTKEGALAGPRVLEHVVDTVIEFEGDRHHGLRFIRATKHRFGATDEVGVFEMTEAGLSSVTDASGLFLDDRQPQISGSVVIPVLQGRRPMLIEMQALVMATQLPQPRRVSQGIDGARVSLLMAVLTNRANAGVGMHDVFVSVVGGCRIDDPGADLGLAMAIASSKFEKAVSSDLVVIGELGLGGEVRKVAHMQKRLAEAQRMGFKKAIVPTGSPNPPRGLQLIEVATLREAMKVFN